MGAMLQIPAGYGDTGRLVEAAQNAMFNKERIAQAQISTTKMQDEETKRKQLESLLQTSQNPERDAYDWAVRNDQAMHEKLQTAYLERFKTKVQYDPLGAAEELKKATGE